MIIKNTNNLANMISIARNWAGVFCGAGVVSLYAPSSIKAEYILSFVNSFKLKN